MVLLSSLTGTVLNLELGVGYSFQTKKWGQQLPGARCQDCKVDFKENKCRNSVAVARVRRSITHFILRTTHLEFGRFFDRVFDSKMSAKCQKQLDSRFGPTG
jgi:hypothetical protein